MARHLRSFPLPGANHGAGAGFLLLLCAAAASLVLVSLVLFACGAHRPRRRDDGDDDLVRFYGSDGKCRRNASAAAGLAGAGIAVGAAVRAGEDGDDDERRGEGVDCWGCRGGDGGAGCSSCVGGSACGA